jgi:NlpC/P60 family putative phage cell wall peptidase
MTRAPRPEIVAAARSWLGTPYRHQARCRGAGCDCLGLILGLWEGCIGPLPELPPAYTPDWSEASGQERLWHAASRHLLVLPPHEAMPGDVLLFRMREGTVAKHLGVQTATGQDARFIHAYSRRGVVESRLTPPWARRVVARFAFPQGH